MTYSNKYDKMKIDRIVLLDGRVIADAVLEIEAPRVTGFLAIQDQRRSDAVEYISLSAISSVVVRYKELAKSSPSYYFSPELKVKVER